MKSINFHNLFDMDTIVLDLGSSSFKIGEAERESPAFIITPVLGKHKRPNELNYRESFIGNDALQKSELLYLSKPIEKGEITDWNCLETLLPHVIYSNHLKSDVEENRLLICDSPVVSTETREKLAELIFEKYKFPYLLMASTATMALFSSQNLTGTVLQCGYDISTCVSIYQGITISKSIFSSDIGGYDCSKYLTDKLYARHNNNVTWYPNIIDEIKKQHGYVALDYEQEILNDISNIQRTYNHTNGNSYSIERERYCCSELLFQPSMIGKECPGIHQILNDSITNSASDLRPQLYRNIILSGGTSSFTGFQKRLEKEIRAMTIKEYIKMESFKNGDIMSWIGGSYLGQTTDNDSYLTKEEYNENGTSIIKNKFFL